MNFHQHSVWPEDFLSNLHADRKPSANFRLFSERPIDLLSIAINIPCSLETFHQILSTFRATRRTSVNFRQLPNRQETFRQLLSNLRVAERPFINFLCGRETFRQLPSTFHAAWRPSVNCRQLSVHLGEIPLTSINFPYGQSLSINFLCSQENFINFCQLFVRLGHLPSISVNISCGRVGFRQLSSTYHAAIITSINFCLLYVWLGELLSTFINLRPKDLLSKFCVTFR